MSIENGTPYLAPVAAGDVLTALRGGGRRTPSGSVPRDACASRTRPRSRYSWTVYRTQRRLDKGVRRVSEAYVVDGVRTPIGSFGGSLSEIRPDDLGSAGDPATDGATPQRRPVDELPSIIGCANQAGEDNRKCCTHGASARRAPGQCTRRDGQSLVCVGHERGRPRGPGRQARRRRPLHRGRRLEMTRAP